MTVAAIAAAVRETGCVLRGDGEVSSVSFVQREKGADVDEARPRHSRPAHRREPLDHDEGRGRLLGGHRPHRWVGRGGERG